MKERAQGSLEYIMLIAGVLLILVLVVFVIKTDVLTPASQNVNSSSSIYKNVSQCNINANSNFSDINSTCLNP